MKRIARWSLLATLSLTISIGTLLAQPGPGRNGPDERRGARPERGQRLERCLSILDLDQAQEAQIRTILENARPEFEALREESRAAHETLRDAVESDADDCAIGAAFLAVHETRDELGELREAVGNAVAAVLTPEPQLRLSGCLESPRHGRRRGAHRNDD